MSCITYPAVAGQPFIPSRLVERIDLGWNAGANSELELDNDVRVRFTMAKVIGAVVGLGPRAAPPAFERIPYGLYFSVTASGEPRVRVIEGGATRTAVVAYMPGDMFEVQRHAGRVTYLHRGHALRTSSVPSAGPVVVLSSLYSSGDQVG